MVLAGATRPQLWFRWGISLARVQPPIERGKAGVAVEHAVEALLELLLPPGGRRLGVGLQVSVQPPGQLAHPGDGVALGGVEGV